MRRTPATYLIVALLVLLFPWSAIILTLPIYLPIFLWVRAEIPHEPVSTVAGVSAMFTLPLGVVILVVLWLLHRYRRDTDHTPAGRGYGRGRGIGPAPSRQGRSAIYAHHPDDRAEQYPRHTAPPDDRGSGEPGHSRRISDNVYTAAVVWLLLGGDKER